MDEFGGAQEVVIAGGIQFDAVHPVGVYQDIVEIPEIDVRQVLGDDAAEVRRK